MCGMPYDWSGIARDGCERDTLGKSVLSELVGIPRSQDSFGGSIADHEDPAPFLAHFSSCIPFVLSRPDYLIGPVNRADKALHIGPQFPFCYPRAPEKLRMGPNGRGLGMSVRREDAVHKASAHSRQWQTNEQMHRKAVCGAAQPSTRDALTVSQDSR